MYYKIVPKRDPLKGTVKYYAQAVYGERVAIRFISEELEGRSSLTRGDIFNINVREWCSDLYGGASVGGDYPANQTDPQGLGQGSGRPIRGGVWNGGPDLCRINDRQGNSATTRNQGFGFRLALAPGSSPAQP